MRGVTSTDHVEWHRLGTDRLDIRPIRATRGMTMKRQGGEFPPVMLVSGGYGMVLTTMEPAIRRWLNTRGAD